MDPIKFALGDLWTRYMADRDEFEGFVICTTRANDQMAAIHDRMPVILDDPTNCDACLQC